MAGTFRTIILSAGKSFYQKNNQVNQIIKTQGEYKLEYSVDDAGLKQGEHKQYFIKTNNLFTSCTFKDGVLVSGIKYYDAGKEVLEFQPVNKTDIDFIYLNDKYENLVKKPDFKELNKIA